MGRRARERITYIFFSLGIVRDIVPLVIMVGRIMMIMVERILFKSHSNVPTMNEITKKTFNFYLFYQSDFLYFTKKGGSRRPEKCRKWEYLFFSACPFM